MVCITIYRVSEITFLNWRRERSAHMDIMIHCEMCWGCTVIRNCWKVVQYTVHTNCYKGWTIFNNKCCLFSFYKHKQFFVYFSGGLQCVAHSFAYVAPFLSYFWEISGFEPRVLSKLASRRDTNIANHLHKSPKIALLHIIRHCSYYRFDKKSINLFISPFCVTVNFFWCPPFRGRSLFPWAFPFWSGLTWSLLIEFTWCALSCVYLSTGPLWHFYQCPPLLLPFLLVPIYS